ncbi:MAG: hypothetical protein ACYDCF_11160 [Burkholderiales bacterium]
MRHLCYSRIALFFTLIFIQWACRAAGFEIPEWPREQERAEEIWRPASAAEFRGPPFLITQPQAPGAGPPAAASAPQSVLRIDQCASIEVAGENWLDQAHDYVDRKLCQPAVWFDDFFGEERVLEDLRPTMFVSLRNSARWAEGDGLVLVPDYMLRYRLPRLDRFLDRANLYVVSQSVSTKFTAQPGQPIDPGVDPATGDRKPVVGVRADVYGRFSSLVSIDTGLKVKLPLDPFARVRYQNTKLSGDAYILRFTENALWRYVEHFTATSQLDLELIKTTFTLIRWSNYATYIEGTPGLTWNTGLSFLTQLTAKSAASLDTSMWGATHPLCAAVNYRIGAKYRRNFYRAWLFYEVEPQVTWPRTENGGRAPVYALMTTLEAQFGK